ncbi:serine/threonine-protein kinase prpf4B-like [Cynara cardunculus var. scolymus]|uniref:serine/threonine-protein kinase prpf4B-like n=1 Tax=Cynara cardunculus var. scolymus TaxID=59895 RepID=UPI000D62ED69|nr:serine/threonine-protein kinase prpf4B-like [Cynara cardunculus var. scolymus]
MKFKVAVAKKTLDISKRKDLPDLLIPCFLGLLLWPSLEEKNVDVYAFLVDKSCLNIIDKLPRFVAGMEVGLKLTAVRAYLKQLFIALKHLRNYGVLHTDIKPNKMLVNEAKNVLKLCDFGNAMFVGKNEVTPYLVSRFYRALEIILGLTYDHPVDMWSIGCCLFELYTWKVLFTGATNDDMLRLHVELKGFCSNKFLTCVFLSWPT